MSGNSSAGRKSGPTPRRSEALRRDQVIALLEPAVQETGLELEDVDIRSVGRRLVVRVLVDTEGGINLDQVATVSHVVSDALEISDVLGDEAYTLEVSSPGIDRPLTLPRHWRRNLTRLVAITLTNGQVVTGRILALSDTEVELEIDTKGRKSKRSVAFADIAKALVQVEFNRSAVELTAEAGDDVDNDNDDDDDDDDDDLNDDDDDDDDDDDLHADDEAAAADLTTNDLKD